VRDDHPRRPFDHHVEPLFAGLGVGEPAPPREGRRGGLALGVLLALAAAALLVWSLG